MESKPNRTAIAQPNPAELRDVLRFWTTGVTIIGSHHQGTRHGMTANSFTSLSLEPPLVLISLEKITRTHGLVKEAGVFGVSILAADQQELSNRFAGRETELSNRFENVSTFSLETGSPLLSDAIAFFDCRVSVTHDAGTHTIFISDVLAAGVNPGGDQRKPLVYFNRNYRDIKTSES
jgi:flavin reductase (DIM6/NTAB) family NADH-FMN oxidoreductase RutF